MVALLCLPLLAFGQSQVLQVYKIRTGYWNQFTESFDRFTEQESGMQILLEKNVVRISDEAHSVYIVNNSEVKQNDSEAIVVQWDAVDEKARPCAIFMAANRARNEKIFSVVYPTFILHYFYY
jgi:hypothetical protein